jgi:asparagine synthase (glutamine-hydrolysing)
MCGILGVLSRNLKSNINLDSAIDLLAHRGPDSRGRWHEDNIYLGHTRLSILDLSPLGHQPMSDRDERFWITFNGEIYNYLELRQELLSLGHCFVSQSDTEVLLAAYSQWGESCLEKLRGMFAFGIWDRKSQNLFLARDRCGEKPLYYWQDEDSFYFASELKALLALLPRLPELNPVAIDLYLHYQYVPEPLTPLSGVFKLPAAHCLALDLDNLQVQPKPYWSLDRIEPITGDPKKLIREQLDSAIELTLRSDVPVGIALSGGIDSCAIATLAAPKYKDTLNAFSIGYPDRPRYDERTQAEDLAKSLGLPFYDLELKTKDIVDSFPNLVAASDDPIADIAVAGHYGVMKLANDRGVKVMLSGIGGDELFWGYPWIVEAIELTEQKKQYWQNPRTSKSASTGLEWLIDNNLYQQLSQNTTKVPKFLRMLLRKMDTSRLVRQNPKYAVFYDLESGFRNVRQYSSNLYTDSFAARLPHENAYRPFELDLQNCKDIPLQFYQFVFDTWLVSNCLALGDRVAMASSVEVRLPLLETKLIETVVGLSKTQVSHRLGHKFWLKSALEDIIPAKILNRPKRGFNPPVKEWQKGIINRYSDWLKDGYLVQLDLFDRAFISKTIDNFERNRQHLTILYKLVLLETWYRKVVIASREVVIN